MYTFYTNDNFIAPNNIASFIKKSRVLKSVHLKLHLLHFSYFIRFIQKQEYNIRSAGNLTSALNAATYVGTRVTSPREGVI